MIQYFLPQILEKRLSKFSGEIKVVKQFGQVNIWAGGFEQSGKLVSDLWDKAIAGLSPATTVLILGLGAGTIVKNLDKNSKITGVEIDPVMIELGQKYFGLNEYKSLKIKCVDANKFETKEKFDLIIWDLYLGGVANINGINKLTDWLNKDGEIIFNQLCFGKNQIDLESVIVKTGRYVINRIVKTEYNKLIFGSRRKA